MRVPYLEHCEYWASSFRRKNPNVKQDKTKLLSIIAPHKDAVIITTCGLIVLEYIFVPNTVLAGKLRGYG